MRASIVDPAALRAVSPFDAAAYLRSTGWTLGETLPGRYARYTRPSPSGEGPFEIDVPATEALGDYALRMSEMLRTLEVVEQRSQLAIFDDLTIPSADLVRIRAQGSTPGDGTLGLDEAVRLVDHSRDLLLAAACAAVTPRAYFERRKPGDALDFVRRIRMGQTLRGSFVLSLISRVPPALAEPAPEPYERRVLTTLASALDALSRVTTEAGMKADFAPFRDAVSHGVSANLCAAIAGMAGERGDSRRIDVALAWSRNRPAPATPLPTQFSFFPGQVEVIAEAARVLRETASREDFELEGVVVRLENTSVAEGEPGTVVVAAPIDGRPRQVTVELPADDYRAACEAHRDGTTIRCVGTLVKRQRAFALENARNFTFVRD